MVEWYPHVLVVSTLFPAGPAETLNMVEFYYPEEIAAFEREFVEAEQAAYMETCIEDDEIAERMDAGRKALMERGDDEVGPYQSPMEDGMQHFHEWYRRQIGRPLARPASAGRDSCGRPRLAGGGRCSAVGGADNESRLMVLASLLFATMGVCVKLASAHYATGEIVFYRGLVGLAMMSAVARWQGGTPHRGAGDALLAQHPGVTALCLWFYAIGNPPLATAMTLNYMSSVWMALFLVGGAIMLGGQRVDGRLIATILAGLRRRGAGPAPTIEHDQLWHGLVGLLSGMLSATAYLQVTALGRAGEPGIPHRLLLLAGGVVAGALTMLWTGITPHRTLEGPASPAGRGPAGDDRAADDDARLRHRPHAGGGEPAVPGHRLRLPLRRAAVRRPRHLDGAGRHGLIVGGAWRLACAAARPRRPTPANRPRRG